MIILVFTVFITNVLSAQTPKTDELIQVHSLTNTDFSGLSTPIQDGTMAFNSETKKLYVYSNTIWKELLFSPNVITKTSDYTLQISDNFAVFTFDSSTDVTLTIPSGLPVGFNVSVYQLGVGKVIIQGSGTTVLNRLLRFKTAGKDSGIGIVSTAIDIYRLSGDLKK